MKIEKIQSQIENHRRTVSFDSYDITIKQLQDMILDEMIDVAPEYQRHFIWDAKRQSQLIESLILGIPIPNLFMATNKDSTWEVVDGLQRLTTIINFVGSDKEIAKVNSKCKKLRLEGLEKLEALNGLSFDALPKSIQIMFLTRSIRVTVLNDRSDFGVRFDLFERLNTGGVTLHPQEIRNCLYGGEFNEFIKNCIKNTDFIHSVKISKTKVTMGNHEEMVLRFFAYYEARNDFVHSVKDFLNDYMESKTKKFANKKELEQVFNKTFAVFKKYLPDGIVRGNRKKLTPVVLFEAVSVGVCEALQSKKKPRFSRLQSILNDPELRRLTTGATNSLKMVVERIEFVKTELLK